MENHMLGRFRIRYQILLIFGVVMLGSNLILFLSYDSNDYIAAPHDADRMENGNTLVTHVSFGEMMVHLYRKSNQIRVDPTNPNHKIVEYDSKGKVIWEFLDVAYPHEVLQLPNGHLLVADTGNDRVIEIDYPNTNIVWSWEPSQIDWSQINPDWDSTHYYNNPFTEDGDIIYDWTHVNDVEFKNYGTWEACLISLRNFDLVVEIDYTADKLNPNDPSNIKWWFGNYGNFDLLHHQHNPDYLESGNILISDSENNRIIEVDYDTKEIVWEYGKDLYWPRDADELDDGTILITDSNDCEVLLLDKEQKKVLWTYQENMIIPYEADCLENGNILISTEYNGIVIEVNEQGQIVWQQGHSFIQAAFYLNSIIILITSLTSWGFLYKKMQASRKQGTNLSKKFFIAATLISLSLIGALIILLFYNSLIVFLVRVAHSVFGSF